MHAAGAGLGVVLLIGATATGDWRLIAAAVAAGYGCAWAGHFLVEGNRPATFGHPLWSLVSDARMLGLMAAGRLGREFARHGIRPGESETEKAAPG